jgi:hypothetical protein
MRFRVEQVLRGIVIVILAVMFWESLHEQTDSGGRSVSARGIGRAALADWSLFSKAPSTIHVQLDSVPSKLERAWMGALAGAGSSLTWGGDLPAVMIDAQPVASPARGTRVLIAAPGGSSVVLSDDVGVIDTLRAQGSGASVTLNSVAHRLTARTKNSVASTLTRDSVVLHRILVIGEAGWESKFVVAALEEEGWKVDALIRVAPGADVTQGSAAIDTSRYSAVVALDAGASPYANRITEFARNGGGVILGPGAASLDAMAPLRAGAVGRSMSQSRAIHSGGSVSLATLALAPIASLRSDAVPLERRGGVVAIAARRVGAGRALQLGYEDTWRWRMGGGEQAVRDHRVWWTGLVSSVVYGPRPSPATTASPSSPAQSGVPRAGGNQAPLADLVANIGPSVTIGLTSSSRSGGTPILWLFMALAAALLGEVASRRMRGAS